MGADTPTAPHRTEWVAVAVLSVLGGFAVWWSTGLRGVGLTTDSVSYLSTANNIGDGRGFGSWLQTPLTQWPLGYPVLLSVVSRALAVSVLDAGRVIGVAVSIGTGWATWRLALRVIPQPWLRVGTVVAVVFAVATTSLQGELLTDALFTLLALLLLLALLHVVEARSLAWAVVAVVLVWLLFLVRYQGVLGAFVGAGILLLFPADRRADRPLGRRVRSAVGFGACGLVVPLLYLARTASGFRDEQARDAGRHELVGGLREVPHVFAEWAAGKTVPSSVGIAAGLVVLVVLATAAVVVAWRSLRSADAAGEPASTASPVQGSAHDQALAVVGCYWLGSLVFLTLLRFAVYFDIDTRTLSLLYPVLVVFAAALLARLRPGVVATAAAAAFGVWCIAVASLGVRSLADERTHGRGYTDASYDATFAELRATDLGAAIPPGCDVRSNAPDVLYLVGVEAHDLPEGSSRSTGPICLVWVDAAPDPGGPSRSAVLDELHLVPLHEGRTFALYAPPADR